MFNGQVIKTGELSAMERSIIDHLLEGDQVNIKNKMDKYVLNTFELYKHNKIQIFLDLNQLRYNSDVPLCNKIMHELREYDEWEFKEDDNNEVYLHKNTANSSEDDEEPVAAYTDLLYENIEHKEYDHDSEPVESKYFMYEYINIYQSLEHKEYDEEDVSDTTENENGIKISPFSMTDTRNLFRGDIIFQLFPNLQSIVINSNDFYVFSFPCLLQIISKSQSIKMIKIQGSWVHIIWSSNALRRRLSSIFQQTPFIISKHDHKDDYGFIEQWITIKRD